ncbi:MAG: hypothetical protein RQ741_10255 [Wenzhouxiangellaceae bacterium]|nr:hypothetical protein [Wenzhouxiangellaceae bacterium]
MDIDELRKQREELMERLRAIKADLESGLPRDMEDQSQRLENQQVLEEIARVTESRLEAVEREIRALETR